MPKVGNSVGCLAVGNVVGVFVLWGFLDGKEVGDFVTRGLAVGNFVLTTGLRVGYPDLWTDSFRMEGRSWATKEAED